MWPCPEASSAGSRALVICIRPRTLTSHIQRHWSLRAAARGSSPRAPPALLTSTSTRSRPAQKAATLLSSATSRTRASAPIRAASSRTRSSRRAPRRRWNPSPASRVAIASPMPALAPVTTASGREGAAVPACPSAHPRRPSWSCPGPVARWLGASQMISGMQPPVLGGDAAQPGVGPAHGDARGEVLLGELGDRRVVGVADVGERGEHALGHQLGQSGGPPPSSANGMRASRGRPTAQSRTPSLTAVGVR